MKLDKKTLMIGGVVILVGAIGFYLYKKSGSGSGSGSGSDDLKSGDADLGAEMDLEGLGSSSVDPNDPRFNQPIKPNLNWVTNKRLASYLGTLLKSGDENRLRGWVTLINKEKDADPSAYPEQDGLTGQDSVILHALYQMQKQSNLLLLKKGVSLPKTHSNPATLFSNDVKFAVIDAQ